MASNPKSTEAGTLELYRVALENVQEQPEIEYFKNGNN